ncbi:DMT family transporter [Hyalangium versicolor]|uniref:DMT family transporter n=1 Tax=Hyalangium versicolor TaxID=2861190 RepID=UPI001CD005CF|nr:DMT family transporter [Hyalangium versicolor]
MSLLDLGLTLLVMMIWGCNYAFAKLGLHEVPPFALLSLRFLLVGALAAPFAKMSRRHLPRLLALSGVLGTLHFGLVYLGLTRVDAATGAVLVQLQVPMAGILSFLVLRERPGLPWCVGAGLAFLGTLTLFGEPRLSAHWGYALLIVLSAVAWAVSYLLLKDMQKPGPIDPFSVNAWMSLLTAPQLAVISMLVEQEQLHKLQAMSAVGWASLAYQVLFVGLLAYAIWYHLIARYPVSITSPFTLTIPVFSALAGALILHEPIQMRFVLGAGLTLAGVGVIMLRSARVAKSALPRGSGAESAHAIKPS